MCPKPEPMWQVTQEGWRGGKTARTLPSNSYWPVRVLKFMPWAVNTSLPRVMRTGRFETRRSSSSKAVRTSARI